MAHSRSTPGNRKRKLFLLKERAIKAGEKFADKKKVSFNSVVERSLEEYLERNTKYKIKEDE